VKEISKAKTIKFDVILRIDVCQLSLVIDKVVNVDFPLSLLEKVGHILRRVERGPICVGDAGVGREISECKCDLIQIREVM
jgi:hypothetical protein